LGRFVFENIPIGYYRVVCRKNETPSHEKEISDSLYAGRTDFPEWHFKPWPYPKNILHQDPRAMNKYLCIGGIVDSIRVATDSISIVKIARLLKIENEIIIFPPPAEKWPGEIRPRNPIEKK